MSDVRGLVDYLEDFIAQNTVQGDLGVALDLSSEEYQALADFLCRGMVVWMLGVERARWSSHRRLLAEVPPTEQPEPQGNSPSEASDKSNVIIWRAL
jgi:hypothetical protein